MAIEVRLPQYGMGMQEGTIVQWFKHEGDRVEAGELLAEIEAEKATEELAAPGSGVLDQILVPEGTTVPVRELLALLDPGDGTAPVLGWRPVVRPVPGFTGRDVAGGRSPGRSGRSRPVPAAGRRSPVIPLAGIRGRIADRMHSSLRDMAQLTLTTTADVTDLVAYRDRWPGEPRPSYTDMVVKAAALALRRHPMLNATVEGDHIRLLPDIHIGIATAVDEGLLVPVVRECGREVAGPDRGRVGEPGRAGSLG